MRYRVKYFPALWLDMRGHPTCRRRRACVAGHVSLVRACSGQRFPLVIRCDAYIRCGLHPWARRKSICVVTSWTKYASIDVFSVQFLATCPPTLLFRGWSRRGRRKGETRWEYSYWAGEAARWWRPSDVHDDAKDNLKKQKQKNPTVNTKRLNLSKNNEDSVAAI